MSRQKKFCVWMLNGFVLGAASLIPGLSAGTMAVVMGIYKKIIFAVSRTASAVLGLCVHRGKKKRERPVGAASFTAVSLKEDVWFLVCLSAGAAAALLALAGGLAYLLEHYSAWVYAFFIGLIAASLPSLFKQTKRTPGLLIIAAGCALAVWGVSFGLTNSSLGKRGGAAGSALLSTEALPLKPGALPPPPGAFVPPKHAGAQAKHAGAQPPLPGALLPPSLFLCFLSGLLACFFAVLPGLSGGLVLLLLGTYPFFLHVLSPWVWFSFPPEVWLALLIFLLGGFIGCAGVFYFLRLFFQKYQSLIAAIMIGFVIGGCGRLAGEMVFHPSIGINLIFLNFGWALAGGGMFYLINKFKGERGEHSRI